MLHRLQPPVVRCVKMLWPCRFPGTKAAYEAVVDVADNEVIANAQVRSMNADIAHAHCSEPWSKPFTPK